jgi:hypothetical protein
MKGIERKKGPKAGQGGEDQGGEFGLGRRPNGKAVQRISGREKRTGAESRACQESSVNIKIEMKSTPAGKKSSP